MFSLTTIFFLGSSLRLCKDSRAHSNTSCSINSPGRNQITLSRSDFLPVKTLCLLIGDLKHKAESMLSCGQGDLGEGKRNKFSLHESVREEEKGEKKEGNATLVKSYHENT